MTIISKKYNFIFIEVPKTGTTSVASALEKLDKDCVHLHDANYANYAFKHHRASRVKSLIGQAAWDGYFKFGFVREPLDWFRSRMFDEMALYYNPEINQGFARAAPFVGLDFRIPPPAGNVIEEIDVLRFEGFAQFYRYTRLNSSHKPGGFRMLQSSWLDEHDVNIFRFENLEDDLNAALRICKAPSVKLEKLNKSCAPCGDGERKVPYSERAKKLVEHLYDHDIKRFYPHTT